MWVVFGCQSSDPFRDQKDTEGVGGNVHGPDGPWFSCAKCPGAKDDHEVDEDFGQFIRQFVELGLSCFSSKFSWRHLFGFDEVIQLCGFKEVFFFFV